MVAKIKIQCPKLFTDEKGVKYFGYTELLLQAEPDSSFKKLYNMVGKTDSTNRFDLSRNNFFRKEDNFQGKEVFFDAQIKKSNLVNEFSKGIASESHIKVVVNLAGLCVTIRYYKDRNGNEVIIDITARWCIGEGGGGGSNAGGSFTRVEYLSNSNGQWSNPILTGGGGGFDVDVIVPPDPFEPPKPNVVLDPSFANNPKLKCVYDRVMANPAMNTLLSGFANPAWGHQLTMKFGQVISETGDIYDKDAGGITKVVNNNYTNGQVEITINTAGFENKSEIQIAQDIIHEMVHAHINSLIAQASR